MTDVRPPLTPRTSDGKAIFLPTLFPGNVVMYFAGVGDDPTNGRGQGDLFQIAKSTVGSETFEFSFNDWVYIAGGWYSWRNGKLGDWVSFEVYCPQTPVTPASGNGNCNVVNGVIIPAAGDGAYNVDLAQANPVPALALVGESEQSNNGYWDWSKPNTGKGTVSASATPGAAEWHLVAADVSLVRFGAKLPLLGDDASPVLVPAVKPKKILPQWKFRVALYNGTERTLDPLEVVWHLVTARIATT